MVVARPREVEVDAVRLVGGGRLGQLAAQVRLAFQGGPLFREHHGEAVLQQLAGAWAGVVRGEGRAVQGAGPGCLALGFGDAPVGRQVVEQRLHHVPGRDLHAVQAGAHAVRVALPEHAAPAGGLVQASQQFPQVPRELPCLVRQLPCCHPACTAPVETGVFRSGR
ncbi:hypothetical protein JQK87_10670 [Streptomyces sp. G44]|nr:hypothetical protein [Streptomyces sp. G44]